MKIAKKKPLLFSLILLIAFNILDAFFTLKYIKFGSLCESNPFMDALLQSNHYSFIFYKLVVVNFCAIILFENREIKFISFVLYFLTFVYAALMMWWGYVIFLLY